MKVHGISNANEGVNGVGLPLFLVDGVDRVVWIDSKGKGGPRVLCRDMIRIKNEKHCGI